jgi:hypothetical protein
MITRRAAKKGDKEQTVKSIHSLQFLFTNIAYATCQVVGLSKKQAKPCDSADSMSDTAAQEKGEKEKPKQSAKQLAADNYYDDRLSRDSQLDSHLRSLGSET